ncbi:tyrosine-type recombinase/integrase [Acidithiobacillus thiooxidans]|uniref:tyrosine-type recombinase/integrase n=1 Tax=Acidithiobacillus thiooxidans TaxID=930 RepID=UPI0034E96137
MSEPRKRAPKTPKAPRKAPEQLGFFEPAPEVLEAVATAEPLLPESVPEASSRVISTPARRRAAADADRKHLTPLEVDRLLQVAKDNPRTGIRDRCLIFLMFRHGLRVTEACAMRLDQVDLDSRILHVERLKGGLSTTQPLRAEELRMLKSWLQERSRWLRQWDRGKSRAGTVPLDRQALFLSTRGAALSRKTFWALLRRYGEAAGLSLPPHPHMLRHACGFALADQGADTRLIQDYLGHRNIQHTVRYTATNAQRFEKLWR